MFFYINRPVLNMRKSPDSSSEVVSQAFYGEKIDLLRESKLWNLIRSSDSYEGWVLKEGILERKTAFISDLATARPSCHLYVSPDIETGPILTLPYASGLKHIEDAGGRWIKVATVDGKYAFIQRGDLYLECSSISSFTRMFLNCPYTWGGRSSFGFDCSGFVQMVYKEFGVFLPRDAYLQIELGERIGWEDLQEGDLVFWGKDFTRIQHVGIFLSEGDFIHASVQEDKPYLRISNLNDEVWRGSTGSIYPFREAKRFSALLRKHPNTKGNHCDFSSDQHKELSKVSVNK
jgi:SH3-like domain-containing protein